ncbi:hypothetical protein FRX31_008511 [Thalictrum thalictroides]|uniref:Uncharacterized protein n=1 Tax=Thalictrum thalictroides TaxID=46969 RepID=A0A7J6X0H2_THATH|nr:hypothetical protein FRX31_008511 [Thalictrum thalictroides]
MEESDRGKKIMGSLNHSGCDLLNVKDVEETLSIDTKTKSRGRYRSTQRYRNSLVQRKGLQVSTH